MRSKQGVLILNTGEWRVVFRHPGHTFLIRTPHSTTLQGACQSYVLQESTVVARERRAPAAAHAICQQIMRLAIVSINMYLTPNNLNYDNNSLYQRVIEMTTNVYAT